MRASSSFGIPAATFCRELIFCCLTDARSLRAAVAGARLFDRNDWQIVLLNSSRL